MIFTIVSMNYIAYAATLMQSVRRHHPDAARFIVLADTPRPYPALDLAAELIPCDALGIGLIDNMRLWYSVIEFNTALKPYAFRHFLDRGEAEICYLDPDIVLHAPLSEAFAALRHNSIVLTPHLLRPLTEAPIAGELLPDDLTILKAGVYNLGFLAVRRDADAQRLVEWWAARCYCQCRVDVTANLFTDQRWMDLAPGFVARAAILRHPGYNVAYWNLVHRDVRQAGAAWQVDGQALVFFHFSGLRPDDPTVFSGFQTRFTPDTLGDVATLCAEYRADLAENGWRQTAAAPYGYAAFSDGRPIEGPMRRWLLRAVDEARLDGTRPIDIPSDFFDTPDETAAARGVPMTRMMYQMWLDRPDLRLVFDVHTSDGLEAFFTWFTGPDSEVDGRSQAAASQLYDTHLLRGADAAHPALAHGDPAPPPPWPPVAAESWDGPAAQVATLLGGDAVATECGRLIPLLAALAWERRPDLQLAFPLRTAEGLGDFIGWALTAGCAEGVVDAALFSDAFIAQQQCPAATTPDVPISEALLRSKTCPLRREFLNGWEQFPDQRRGRLAHGLWFAYVAPALFGWPAALTAPVRRYFDEPTDRRCGGFAFNRGELAMWELRADLQQHFPLGEPQGCWGFLQWIATDGLRELALTLEAFDPRLLPFLSAPSPRLQGASQAIEMIHQARPDLQSAFDIATDTGRQALLAWVRDNFAASYGAYPLGAVRPSPPAPVVEPPVHRARIGLTGQLVAATGRAEDLRCAVAALAAAGFADYVVIDEDSHRILLPDGTPLAPDCRVCLVVNIVYRNADTAAEDWRGLRDRHVTAERTIGSWAWELERLPTPWRHAFSFYDEIWAATRFAHGAFAREDRRPVTLVPMAVTGPDQAPPLDREKFSLLADATVFLFVFDFRSHGSRKNPEAVVQAFLAAFPADENVQLLIKTQAGASAPGAWRRLTASCTDRRIVLRDAVLGRDEMAGLLGGCDAFVSLHRAEGFGRLAAEAMRLGTPVIATGYSGTADFVSADCAHVVDFTLTPVEPGAYPGGAGQSWAEPDIAAAARAMRAIHDHPAEASALGERGRARIRALYDPATIGVGMLAAARLTPARGRRGRS